MFTSKVVPIDAENVDTDQIVPARYLKVTDKAGLAEALFRDWRFEEDGSLKTPSFILDTPGMAGRQILLVGDNFGSGSSREHAPWALTAWGVRAILSTGHLRAIEDEARLPQRSVLREPPIAEERLGEPGLVGHLEIAGRDDLVRVDVLGGQRDDLAGEDRERLGHRQRPPTAARVSMPGSRRGSATTPAIALAAAVSGEARKVRPPLP